MTIEPEALRPPSERQAPLKIDIVVHGRFHGFALGKALISLGHDVVVHTNYPASVALRWGLPSHTVRSFLRHGITARAGEWTGASSAGRFAEPYIHRLFGRWAARSIRPDADLIYGFSGVMEEFLSTAHASSSQIRILVRGSAHIREQANLLEFEESRAGVRIDRPSKWMIEREEREYELADGIAVLSSFAKDTFMDREFSPSRVKLNPLGVNTQQFRPSDLVIAERERRILSGQELRILNVGSFSYQKGAIDFSEVARQLSSRMKFKFVGSLPGETLALRRRSNNDIEFCGRVPEAMLSEFYSQADVFLFQTIQDGFAAVLLQAAAAGLPTVASKNSGAPDILVEGKTGWLLPARDAGSYVSRLIWCDENREALVAMSRELLSGSFSRSWTDMAVGLVEIYRSLIELRRAQEPFP